MPRHSARTTTILVSITAGALLSLMLSVYLLFYIPEPFDKHTWYRWTHWFVPLDLLQDTPALNPTTEPQYDYSPRDGEKRALVSLRYQTRSSAHAILNLYTLYFTHLGCDLQPAAAASYYWDTDTRLAGHCPDTRYLQIALEQQPNSTQVRLLLNPPD